MLCSIGMAGKTHDASDPKSVADQEKLAALRKQQRKAVLANLLATVEGREWLSQFLRDCHTFEERVALSNGQYEQGFFNGQREVGLSLMRVLAVSAPQNFALMIQENDIG
jgi:hypothetical protein